MAPWSSRRTGYKLGVLVLFLGSAAYLTGFACPFWYDGKSNGYRSFYGLWVACSGYRDGHVSHQTCQTLASVEEDWFMAVQGLEGVGLILLFFTDVYALVVNLCQNFTGSHNRVLEALASLSGVCGFVGCMVFVGEMTSLLDDVEEHLSWAFGLNLAGSIMVVVAAVTIFVNNRAQPDGTIPPGTLIFTGAAAPVQVVSPQGPVYLAPGQSYPPQSWVGYPAPPAYGCDAGKSGIAGLYPAGYVPAAAPPSVPPEYSEVNANETSTSGVESGGQGQT